MLDRLLSITSTVLVAVALLLVLHVPNPYQETELSHASPVAAASDPDDAVTASSGPGDASALPETDIGAQSRSLAARLAEPDQTLWSEKRIRDYEKFTRSASPGDMPEGILRIPSVKLQLPVFIGTAEANLTRGAGTIEGTAPLGAAGNTGIAGHRDGYFRVLKDIEIGDRITIETLDGTEDYRITDTWIVDPEDVYVLDPTEHSALTLVTCYPFYYVGSAPQRFIVRAEKL